MRTVIGVLAILFGLQALAQDAEWNRTVEAAKQEGLLVIGGPPARALRSALTDEFTKAYPELKIEYVGGFPHELEPRILQERGAGRFLWDVYISGAPSAIFTLKAKGALDPILPALMLPEVKDEKKWIGGFRPGAGFADKAPPLTFFMFDGTASALVHVNRKLVGKDELKTFKDLLDPKWKGKIVMPDPNVHTTTAVWLSNLERVMGTQQYRPFVERLAGQVVLAESFLPVAQKVIVGEYPLGISYVKYVHVFGQEGAPLDYVRLNPVLAEAHHVAVGAKAPHPNAARLFVDTFTSRVGLLALARAGEFVLVPGVYPPIKDADKLRIVMMEDLDEAALKRFRDQVGAIFARR